MSSEVTFTLTITVIFIGIPVVYYRLSRVKQAEVTMMAKDLHHFDKAAYSNNAHELLRLGLKLVRNRHVGTEILNHISQVISRRMESNPELKEVNEAIAKRKANSGRR